MIDYQEETVTIFDPELDRDVTEKIVKWEVWFCTADGTFRNYADAKASDAKGQGPIIPLPVAIGEKIFEINVARAFGL